MLVDLALFYGNVEGAVWTIDFHNDKLIIRLLDAPSSFFFFKVEAACIGNHQISVATVRTVGNQPMERYTTQPEMQLPTPNLRNDWSKRLVGKLRISNWEAVYGCITISPFSIFRSQ